MMAKSETQPKAKGRPGGRAGKAHTLTTRSKAPPRAIAGVKPGARGATQAGDWREETLARVRALILEAVPEMVEERKWKKPSNAMAGVPVWSHNGIVCTGETYKGAVKLTFARGAGIPEASGARLFNSSLEGNTRRAIDIREGERVDAAWGSAFKRLVKAAVALNGSPRSPKGGAQAKPTKVRSTEKPPADRIVLLSGGNPQIAKADGDGPVQAYIAAMSGGGPGWKRDLGKRLDAIITRAAPGALKAVKWNSPFYGIAGPGGKVGWFLSFHVFTRYVKVAFFRGSSLRPVPPGASKDKNTRYLDIREGDELDKAQMEAWVRQAAALPGWVP